MHKRTQRWCAGAVALLAAGSMLAACGDDDDATSAADGSTTTEASSDANVDEYCDATFKIETAGEPSVDFETASEEEQVAAIKSYAKDKLQPLATKIQANAPDEIKADIDVLVGAVQKLGETGDFDSTFGSPEVDAASAKTHAFDLKSCGWSSIPVKAKDYAFQGIPAAIDAGATSFDMTNEGTELHEMVIIRKNDDTKESFDELIAMPQEEAQKKTTIAGSTFVPPGKTDYAVVDLTKGEYIVLCFIPQGTKDENTEGKGAPHFTMGMRQEFTVS